MSNQFPGWRHEPTRPFPPGVVPPVVNMKVLKLEDLWKFILKKTTKKQNNFPTLPSRKQGYLFN